MFKNHRFLLSLYYRVGDLFALNFAFFLGVYLRFYSGEWFGLYSSVPFSFVESNYASLLLFINITWLFIANSQKIYSREKFSSTNRYLFATAVTVLLQFVITVAFNGLIKTFYSRLFLLFTYISFALFLICIRWCIKMYYQRRIVKRSKNHSIVLIGKYSQGFDEKSINDQSNTLIDQKVISLTPQTIDYKELEKINSEFPINEIYISISKYGENDIEELSTFCDNHFIRLRLIFDWKKVGARKLEVSTFNQTAILKVALTPLDDQYNAMLKRIFDICFSTILFIFVFSWLFPIISIAVKLSSNGPIFFKQKRSGLNNKGFNCYKFRSMKVNLEADLKQATQNDARITKVGAFLRKTSLDELPQFINVLKGQMSIVGPRPHMLKHTEEYSNLVGNFMNRHAIKPGITGLAQIKGFRGEIDDFSLIQNRVRLDRFYVNNWTLFFDLKIVFLTVFTMFKDHK